MVGKWGEYIFPLVYLLYNKSPRFIYTKTYTPQKNMGPFCHPLFRGVPKKICNFKKIPEKSLTPRDLPKKF